MAARKSQVRICLGRVKKAKKYHYFVIIFFMKYNYWVAGFAFYLVHFV